MRTRESGARGASLLEGAPREQRAENMRKMVPECGILTEHRPELSDLQLKKSQVATHRITIDAQVSMDRCHIRSYF